MGQFLSMSGVIGKSKGEVENCLRKYARDNSGGLEREQLENLDNNFCVLNESENNTTIFYPYAFMEWDEASVFISGELNCPVFSFHIHDGDLWMYLLYNNGEIIDQFNPLPDYWDDNLSEKEIEEQKGNAKLISDLIPKVKTEDIERYLVRWNLDSKEQKSYPDDEFENIDWQVVDFMKKVGLEYPIDDMGKPIGTVFRFWTEELGKSDSVQDSNAKNPIEKNKPWWRFWN